MKEYPRRAQHALAVASLVVASLIVLSGVAAAGLWLLGKAIPGDPNDMGDRVDKASIVALGPHDHERGRFLSVSVSGGAEDPDAMTGFGPTYPFSGKLQVRVMVGPMFSSGEEEILSYSFDLTPDMFEASDFGVEEGIYGGTQHTARLDFAFGVDCLEEWHRYYVHHTLTVTETGFKETDISSVKYEC